MSGRAVGQGVRWSFIKGQKSNLELPAGIDSSFVAMGTRILRYEVQALQMKK